MAIKEVMRMILETRIVIQEVIMAIGGVGVTEGQYVLGKVLTLKTSKGEIIMGIVIEVCM